MGVGRDIIRDLAIMASREIDTLRERFARYQEGRGAASAAEPKKPRPKHQQDDLGPNHTILGDLSILARRNFKDLGRKTVYAAEDSFHYIKKTPRRWRRLSPEAKINRGLVAAVVGIAASFWIASTRDRIPEADSLSARDVKTFVKLQPEVTEIFAMSDKEYLDDLEHNKKVLAINSAFADIMKQYDGKVVLYDGTQVWTQRGQITRSDGPAVIYPNGDEVWMLGNGPWSKAQSEKVNFGATMDLLDEMAKEDHERVKKGNELEWKRKRGIPWTQAEKDYVRKEMERRQAIMDTYNQIIRDRKKLKMPMEK